MRPNGGGRGGESETGKEDRGEGGKKGLRKTGKAIKIIHNSVKIWSEKN